MVVRRARPADAAAIARVHDAAGRDAYRSFLPEAVLDSPERYGRRLELWTGVLDRLGDQTAPGVEGLWVAVDTGADDDVVGFVHTDRSHDPDAGERTGEVTTFSVATARQGEGIGGRLLGRAVDHLLGCGCDDLRLWTLDGNVRARAYYGARGWTADGATRPVPAEYDATEVRMRTTAATIQAQPPPRSFVGLLDLLLAHPIGADRYVTDAPGWFGPRVFGGLVVAQAVSAAVASAAGAGGAGATGRAHSLHTHFLRAVGAGPVELRTEPIRVGRSFTTVRVDSVQEGRVAATHVVSFHADEDDQPYQLPAPAVPPPTAVPRSDDEPPPFEVRDLGPTEVRPDGSYESTRRSWIRAVEDLPGDPLASLLAVTYLSDMTGTSFRPHSLGTWGTHTDASIDHAVWFHRPPRADRWLLCDFHALVNAGARSTVRGTFHDEGGTLVASMAQELLIRPL